ncbi:uncharacterized protein [Oryctolagus cuniculus]|uniref:uncharacterized protein isoform X1 n=1 Tax=Oryctolagus cuniculus TaxID=9986 RepID=UPI00387A0A7D
MPWTATVAWGPLKPTAEDTTSREKLTAAAGLRKGRWFGRMALSNSVSRRQTAVTTASGLTLIGRRTSGAAPSSSQGRARREKPRVWLKLRERKLECALHGAADGAVSPVLVSFAIFLISNLNRKQDGQHIEKINS